MVVTDAPINLAVESLERAENYLRDFKIQVDKFLTVLQSGGEEEDYDTFVENLKGWITVVQLLDIVRDFLQLDFKAIKVGKQSVDVINGELQNVLIQIKKALEEEDTVYLQDLFRYELIPSIEKMSLVVNKFIEISKLKQKKDK